MYYNYFNIIGVCLDINDNYISIMCEDNEILKVFFNDVVYLQKVKKNVLTKVEGLIVNNVNEIRLIAEKVYQIKSDNEEDLII